MNAEQELLALQELLRSYLAMKSADGCLERRELRKLLAEKVGKTTQNGVDIK